MDCIIWFNLPGKNLQACNYPAHALSYQNGKLIDRGYNILIMIRIKCQVGFYKNAFLSI